MQNCDIAAEIFNWDINNMFVLYNNTSITLLFLVGDCTTRLVTIEIQSQHSVWSVSANRGNQADFLV